MSGRTAKQFADAPADVEVAKSRCCLKCRAAFASAWSGERVCPSCKGSSAWRSSVSLGTRPSGFDRQGTGSRRAGQ
jgi:hypothetical protein